MEYKSKKSKEDAIVVLVSCSSYAEAAKELGVSVPTVYKWLGDPEFSAKLEATRNQIVSDSISKLKTHTTKAADTLALLLDDDNPQIRRGVSNDILNHVLKFIELKELEARLKALEMAQQSRGSI
jgi:transposase